MDATTVYNGRYRAGYRRGLSGYEIARWAALDHFLRNVPGCTSPGSILDYGCGNGLFYPLLRALYPRAEIFGADVSSVALEQLQGTYAEAAGKTCIITGNRTAFADGFFDMVVSIEVMEHVDNLQAYSAEIFRLLKPGGRFVWTTPCANRCSVEYLYSHLMKLVERTGEGYRRWAWEDPCHLRRLTSSEAEAVLLQTGFRKVLFRFRAHLFSFLCTKLREKKYISEKLSTSLMKLDYTIFRCLPSGASMIGCAIKQA